MMDEKSHEIVTAVREAREYGLLGNWTACLQSYAQAKQQAEREISTCRSSPEMARWNSMIKDIVLEEANIRRIKATIEDIQKSLRTEANIPLVSKPKPEVIVSKPDFIATPRVLMLNPEPRKAIRSTNPEKRASVPIGGAKALSKGGSSKKPQDEGNPLKRQIMEMGIIEKNPNVEWDSIAGLHDVKRLLRQNLVILPMRPDIAKGMLAPWKTVLLYGPPGTGKTYLAKAIATECKRTFFNVTSATITSRFHGESEKLVAYLFDLAEEMAPSTVFFDEIDCLASQRGAQNEHEASRRMKAQLLTKLEGMDSVSDDKSVFVLAATNFPWDLDEAMLRRFQKRVYIPLPDKDARMVILELNLQDMIDDSLDIAEWAERLEGYSCADIANMCRDAAQMVFDDQTKMLDTDEWMSLSLSQAQISVTDEYFRKAFERRKSSIDATMIRRYEEWRRLKGAE